MEPVTHVLTGMCLARSGFHRRAAYATLTMGIAAELPDIDTLWGLHGPVSSFQHHRGLTHTFVGVPFEAALLVAFVYLLHRLRQSGDGRGSRPENQVSRQILHAPLRWGALYVFALFALLSHILLDYTNNYGVRPFFPFNGHWYAASIVFIFDPLIFLFLLGGLILPSIFGLVGQEIAGKAESFRGTAWPRAALIAIVVLWLFRTHEHNSAVALANTQTLRAPAANTPAVSDPTSLSEDLPRPPLRPLLLPLRSLASPDPLSPFRWYTATDFGPSYQLATVDTLRAAYSPGRVLNKSPSGPALLAAERSHLGQVYLDWSPMPWVSISTDEPPAQDAGSPAQTIVTFEDVRFMNSLSFLQWQRTPPLTGQVILNTHGNVVGEGIGGRFGK